MENAIENVIEQIVITPVAVEVQAPMLEALEAEKADNRKGKRRVDHADGTRSYGLKADGTPRSKPGRRPTKTA
jgi:hypothetical protein